MAALLLSRHSHAIRRIYARCRVVEYTVYVIDAFYFRHLMLGGMYNRTTGIVVMPSPVDGQ